MAPAGAGDGDPVSGPGGRAGGLEEGRAGGGDDICAPPAQLTHQAAAGDSINLAEAGKLLTGRVDSPIHAPAAAAGDGEAHTLGVQSPATGFLGQYHRFAGSIAEGDLRHVSRGGGLGDIG